jgi:F-box domain
MTSSQRRDLYVSGYCHPTRLNYRNRTGPTCVPSLPSPAKDWEMLPSPSSSDDPSPVSGDTSDVFTSSVGSPINYLPPDALHNILLRLPLRDAVSCRAVSRTLRDSLSSPSFLALLPTRRLLLLPFASLPLA